MKKGAFGYLQKKRTVSLVKSCLLVAAVFIIYYAALRHFQTNRNVFSILAAVMALPAGRSVVITVMCLRAKGASERVRDAVAAVKGLSSAASGFDLCLTSYDRTFSLSHASAAGGQVTGLTEDSATDCLLCGQHIEKILAENGISGRRALIFRDPEAYIRELERLVSEQGPCKTGSFNEKAREEKAREDRRVMQLLYAVSL
ncbi:MAG: hypothetical protein E7237_04515 [Sarcina sp.]|nr:hypothetical protein [Sarcina sp.]